MSVVLDRILQLAADEAAITVTLSAESVTVLLFAIGFIESRKSWLDLQEDPLDEITDAQFDQIERLVANLTNEVLNPVTIPDVIYPIRAEINPNTAEWSLFAGSITPTQYQLPFGAYPLQSVATNLDSFKADVLLAAGEYVMEMWYGRSTTNAKMDIYIDGVQVVFQEDLYLGNLAVRKVYAVNILTDGNHIVHCIANGKNASSTGYTLRVGSITFWQ